MFEKEAKEYAIENYENCIYADLLYTNDSKALEQSFKDGTEFGYNKANEWHFVKNEDLPKENKKYFILTSKGEPEVDSWLNKSWVNSYDVIAWKEIIFPKETLK